jgi:UDP-N-acetylmuramyl pentapeptide synthase
MTTYTAESAILTGIPAESVICCANHREIAEHLHHSLVKGDVILFKGSRGMAMEHAAIELKRLIKGESDSF